MDAPLGESTPGDSYVFAEIPVQAQVHSSQRATPDELVVLGQKIWAEVRDSGVAADDNAGNDALLEKLQTKYKDFATSFPIVLRWMVQLRQFNKEALWKYLIKHSTAKLDTREGFLELQADYLIQLYRETHKRPDEAFIKRYRASLLEQLLEEDKAFMKIQEQVERDLEAKAEDFDRERRQLLFKYLLALKVQREQVGTPGAPPPAAGGGPPAPSEDPS